MRLATTIYRQKRLITALAVIFCGISACQEKKSEVNASPPVAGNSGNTDTGETAGRDTGGGSAFDVCADGLKKADLDADFDGLIAKLCDNGELKTMRQDQYVYTGGATKVRKSYSRQAADETALIIYTSALIDTTPKDYYNFTRLQFSQPAKIRGDDDDCDGADPFLCDSGVSVSDTATAGSSINYNYENVGNSEGGRVFYSATSRFKTLAANQAYVIATKMTDREEPETITKLLGLIVINKHSATKTEVITISDQAYEHTAEEKSAFNSQLSAGLDDEQRRSFKNGAKAVEATAILGL